MRQYTKRARDARPYGVRRCNRRLQIHLTVAMMQPSVANESHSYSFPQRCRGAHRAPADILPTSDSPPQRPPSSREGDRPQAVEGVPLPHSVEKVSSLHLTGFTRRSKPPVLPPIAYRGFAIAPITLRPPSRSPLYNPGCRVATLLVSMGVMGFLGDSRGKNRNFPLIP